MFSVSIFKLQTFRYTTRFQQLFYLLSFIYILFSFFSVNLNTNSCIDILQFNDNRVIYFTSL